METGRTRSRQGLREKPATGLVDQGGGFYTDYGWLNAHIRRIQEHKNLPPTFYALARMYDRIDRAQRARAGLEPPERTAPPASRISKIWLGESWPERETLDVLAAMAEEAGLVESDSYEWRRRGGREPWARQTPDATGLVTTDDDEVERLARRAGETTQQIVRSTRPPEEEVDAVVEMVRRVLESRYRRAVNGDRPAD